MVTRKVTLAGVVLGLLASLAAHAETKRYLVQFKSSDTFQSVAQNVSRSTFTAMGGSVRLFNTNAAVTQALEHLDMLVIESADEKAVQSLRRHPAIALVEEEMFHPAPRPFATWGKGVMRAKPSPATVELPWGIEAVKAPQAWNKTQGQQARVMVLDTGIDKEHEALKVRFEKGRNFTGGNMDDFNDTIGHGTHVAGTIAAGGVNGGLLGVAPQAGILMGKVCGDRGCSSVAIVNGLNWAIQERVDVVNMSLGGFFISAAEQDALRRAESAGVMVVAASGNDGTPRVAFPAAFESVLAVGAIDSSLKKADFSQWGPELDVMGPGVDVISSVPRGSGRGATVKLDVGGNLDVVKSVPFVGSPLRNALQNELVFAGMGKPADFTGANVRGKFALISRGEIPFKEKVANAIARGAAGVIIFNNAPGLLQGALTEDGSEVAIPAAMIEQTVGEQARQMLASGRVVRASISVDATDYAAFQGTSMATPHVAGVAALVRAANKRLTPAQVRDLLKATATPMGPNDQNQYGSGLVNAEAAVLRAETMSAPVELQQVAN